MPRRYRDVEGPEGPTWDPITQGGLLWEMPPGMYGEWFGPRLQNPDYNPEHARAMFRRRRAGGGGGELINDFGAVNPYYLPQPRRGGYHQFDQPGPFSALSNIQNPQVDPSMDLFQLLMNLNRNRY